MAAAAGLIFVTVLLMVFVIVLMFILLRFTEAPHIVQRFWARVGGFSGLNHDLTEESAILTKQSNSMFMTKDNISTEAAYDAQTNHNYYQQGDHAHAFDKPVFEPLPSNFPKSPSQPKNQCPIVVEPSVTSAQPIISSVSVAAPPKRQSVLECVQPVETKAPQSPPNPASPSVFHNSTPSHNQAVNNQNNSSSRRSSLDSVDIYLEGLDEQGLSNMKRASSTDSIESSASALELTDQEQENGQLQIRLQYDQDTQMLHIWILQAFDLRGPQIDMINSEFWVVLFLLPHQKPLWRSQLQTGASNPQFHEEFKQCVRIKDMAKVALLCQVYTRRTPSLLIGESQNVSMVGQSKVRLKDFNVNSANNLNLSLLPVNADGDEPSVGELLLSLNYQPSSERLSVVIAKIKYLKQDPGHTDSFSAGLIVRAYLVQGAKVHKKKTSPQTLTAEATEPVEFNESMIFNLPQSKLDKVYLRLSICLVGQSRYHERFTLGHVTIGSRRCGKELGHWQQMVDNPRKPIAMWQAIRLKKSM